MGKKTKHPMQPLEKVDGVVRFKKNDIVRFLLDTSANDINKLRLMPFNKDDWNQFYQLIGYSVNGFGELQLADPKTVKEADKLAEKLHKD